MHDDDWFINLTNITCKSLFTIDNKCLGFAYFLIFLYIGVEYGWIILAKSTLKIHVSLCSYTIFLKMLHSIKIMKSKDTFWCYYFVPIENKLQNIFHWVRKINNDGLTMIYLNYFYFFVIYHDKLCCFVWSKRSNG